MDGSGRRGLLFLLVLFVIAGHIGNAQETCRTGCKSAGASTFKYAVGTTYKYNYDGKIDISLSSAEGQSTNTELKAEVFLTQLPDCNQVIRLQNVQIVGQTGKKIPDIEKPIRINNNDGLLDDSICIVDGDSQNSINIKRAIASIFQASTKGGYETDVFGRCPTDVSFHREGNVAVIQKTRSLNKCSFREHVKQDFLATALNFNSEIKSSPILNGEYSAHLKVKNGILDQGVVTEDYLFIPFSVGKNGAKAHIESKLSYVGTAKDASPAPVNKPRSIIFENPHPVTAPTSNVQSILNAVKEVAKTVDIVVGESTAREFVSLLKTVRVSTKNDLLAVYNQVKSGVGVGHKDAAKRLYLDALLRSGTGESIEALLELFDKKELSALDSKLALIGLNTVRHATKESLNAATHLLDTPKLPREAYLGIGNLAGKFCHEHECDQSAEIKALTAKLLSKIVAKPTNRDQENDTVFALKALGNFHSLHESVISKLTAIAQNKNLPSRVRVAALETYLADACTDKLRNSALHILQDIQQDSEVRIKAYLAIAQCPNAKVANEVKNLLNKEPSIQVGGFITSHLHAIRSSANPDKALAKKFLGFSPRKSFPIDPRKFSFNGEFSYAIDTLGLGASSEANVIYSQNSWLPRSTLLNLTAEVFGHSFNFLELEIRQENLDRLIEHYFGPKGVLKKSVLSNLVKEGKTSYDKLAQYAEEKLKSTLHRNKRDVSKAEIDSIAKHVQIKTNELNKDLDVDVSLKTFGAEIFFLNINQDTKVRPEAVVDNIIAQLTKGIDQLQKFQEIIRRNLLFLDAEFDYPTSLGFPLRLAVEGTANVQIDTEGNIDIRQLINQPDKGGLKLKLISSANIEVTGRLTIDALLVENGLKVLTSMFTSTGDDLTASWNKATGFDVKLGLPVAQQKFLSLNHEIVFAAREQSGHEKLTLLKFTQEKDFSICFDQFSSFIGLTPCIEVNGPNLGGQQIPILPYPLAGDAKFSLTLENDDVSEFHIKNILKDGHSDLLLETIGKDGKQKVALDLTAEYHPEKFIRAVLSSPAKHASAEARIVITNVEKALLLKFMNDKDEFSGKVGVAVSGTTDRTIFKPLLEYKTPAGQQPLPVSTEGQVVVEKKGDDIKFIFENLKISDSQRQLVVSGNIGRESGIFFTDLTMSDNTNKLQLDGRLQLTPELIKLNIKEQNSIDKNANFNLQGELKRKSPAEYDMSIQLIHGPDLNSKTSILTITSSIHETFKTPTDFHFETKNSIRYPLLGISGKFDLEQTPKSVDYEVEAQYGELKLGSELEAKISEKTLGDYDVEFEIWGLDNKLEVKTKRQVLPNDESKILNILEVNGKKFEVDGKIKHSVRPRNIDVGTDLTIKIPSHAAPYKVNTAIKATQEEIDAFGKIGSGSDQFIDAFLKANKKGDVNGSLKINIKKALSVNGQIRANDGKGNGDILIDLQDGKRQIKGETSFTVQPAHAYDISLTIYPSFNKDKNMKIFLTTNSKVTENSIDSKNKVDILGQPLEFNTKLSKIGDSHTGKIDGELEITLPGEQYLLIKTTCDHKEQNDLSSGLQSSSIEYRKNKNSPGRKYGYKANWKNSDFKDGIIDGVLSSYADDSLGRNVNSEVILKSSKQGETYQINLSNKVTGTVLKNPFEVTLVSSCKKGVVTSYELKSIYGPANSLSVKGNYDFSVEKKTGALAIQLASESEHLKSLNIDLSGAAVPHSGESDKKLDFLLEGKANVLASNAQGVIVDLKTDGHVKVGPTSGKLQGKFALNRLDEISAEAQYEENNGHGISSSAAVHYGKGQTVKYDLSLEKSDNHQYKLTGALQTPIEGYKNSQITVVTKRSKDSKQIDSQVELTVEGKKWQAHTDLALSEISPKIDVKLTLPDGKLQQFYLKANKVSDRQYGGELKLVNEEKSFIFEGGADVNVENIENLVVTGHLHSPTLNLNKISFEAHNKGSAGDHKIQVVIKTGGKNYISGNLAYAAKEENGKLIVDGSGNFKVKDESKSGNFKYIIERLSAEKNGEDGILISFDAAVGDKAIDSEYKMTNKHFRLSESYCEQKKECAYIEVDNKIESNSIDQYNQVLEINLDLRKLGLSHEFGLKAVTNRKQWVIDHTVDAHFQNQENSKYQYSFRIHPSDFSASLTSPKRIIAFEGKIVPPKNIKEGGKTTGEVAFYMDKKNHPNKKTALTWFLDVDLRGKIIGESKFNHPGLRKPLTASFKATREGTPFNGKVDVVSELDVFAQENQKLVFTFHESVTLDDAKTKGTSKTTFALTSAGLGIGIQGSEIILGDRIQKVFTYDSKLNYKAGKSNYENQLASKWSPNEVSGIIKVFNKVLLKGDHRIKITDNDQIIESEISSINNDPVISRLEIKNYNTLAYSLSLKSQPSKKLLFNAGLISGQIADVRADLQDGNNKVNLFFASIKLDDANFLKPDHKVDSKAIQDLAQKVKTRSLEYVNSLEDLSKEWADEARQEFASIRGIVVKAAPELQPLQQYYTKELQEIKEEILSDKSIKELGEAIRKVLGSLIAATSEVFEKISKVVEESAIILQNSFTSVIDSIEKELIPQLKQHSSRILASGKQILETVLDIGLGILAKASEILEKYQPELQELATIFGELFQDFGKLIYKAYENAQENIKALSDRIANELRTSPYLNELKANYEQLIKEGIPSADAVINTVREIFVTIKDAIPDNVIIKEDIQRAMDQITDYLEKKLKNQPVDDAAALTEIFQTFALMSKKLISVLSTETLKTPTAKFESNFLVYLGYLKNLPSLVAVRFSPISYVMDKDSAQEIVKFLLGLVDNPRNLIPPFPLFAIISHGQHIFTFDHKHITLPGKCNYLFARDALNENFTLAGSYKEGQLISITLVDESGSITLIQGGKVKSNNDVVELPFRKTTLAIWRDYETVTLFSTAGVTVICTPDLIGCTVKVSGFYHGQVRGLLGNGNSEPFDDLTDKGGKIVTGEEQFVNSYKMSNSCPAVTLPKHDAVPENAECNKLFKESSFLLCYPFIPTDNFRAACAHGLAAGIKRTEEAIAKAYVAACQERNIPVHVPERLVKCTNSEKPYDVGTSFSVKLPSKSADIVLIVETVKANQALYDKLVKTLVPEINAELRGKGVRDIEYHLITYGGSNQWPSHVTVNGKLVFKENVPSLKFDDKPADEYDTKQIENPKVQKTIEDLKQVLHDLSLATGMNLKARTFEAANDYPFRVNALKSIIVFNSKPCEVGKLYPLQELFALTYKNSQISLNLFTPFTTLTTSPKKNDIVGFNTQNVFTLSQAKKSPKGTAELHKELNYDDYCVDFTVKNRGNAFVNDNFLTLSDAEQKQYVKLAATNIAEQLVNLEQGLDCECKLVNPWNALNKCREAYSKERSSKKV